MPHWQKVKKNETVRNLTAICADIMLWKMMSWLDSWHVSIKVSRKQESGSKKINGSDQDKQHKHGSLCSLECQPPYCYLKSILRHTPASDPAMIPLAETIHCLNWEG